MTCSRLGNPCGSGEQWRSTRRLYAYENDLDPARAHSPHSIGNMRSATEFDVPRRIAPTGERASGTRCRARRTSRACTRRDGRERARLARQLGSSARHERGDCTLDDF